MHFGRLLVPIPVAAGLAALALVASAPAGAAPVRATPASTAQHGMVMRSHPVILLPGAAISGGTVHSRNWSGYVSVPKTTAGGFKAISATFNVPSVNCSKTPHSVSVHWVGIDGFGNKTVEQDGVLSQCAGKGGKTAQYAAWWENFPANPVRVVFRVRPGDAIIASVFHKTAKGVHHNQYNLVVRDVTTGKRLNVWKKCGASTCQNSSAEIISEAPTGANGVLPLSDYGIINYESIKITDKAGQSGGVSSSLWSSDKIIESDSAGHTLATPSALFGGRAFTSTWHRRT
ncbi:MAG TPA: G1 family glutamic endopeptidase [Streptosporangiaceae bacterium]|jgi:hypothetical protein